MMNNASCAWLRGKRGPTQVALAVVLVALACQGMSAQRSFRSGLNVSPAYEGWEKNPDGSFTMIFGYMNSNWEEEPNVPIGPANAIEPGGPDQGQPTRFQPRRNRFVFKVRVPADFGDKELIWTLTTNGVTERAYGTLAADYFVDSMVFISEKGGIGAGSSNPEIRANVAPVVELEGPRTRTVRVGERLALIARATDDGIPRPRRRGNQTGGAARPADAAANTASAAGGTPATAASTPAAPIEPLYRRPSQGTVGSDVGLRVSWYVYRGSGKVSFDPPQIKTWEDSRAYANSPWANNWRAPDLPPGGRFLVEAVFDEPGTYTLRCLADDGGLWDDEDIVVTVVP